MTPEERIRQLEDELAGCRAALHDLQEMKPDEAELLRWRGGQRRPRLLVVHEELSELELLQVQNSDQSTQHLMQAVQDVLIHAAAREINVPPHVVEKHAWFQWSPRPNADRRRVTLSIWVDDLGKTHK